MFLQVSCKKKDEKPEFFCIIKALKKGVGSGVGSLKKGGLL
jgi:hypothetical protein